MANDARAQVSGDEIDIWVLAKDLWRYRWAIFALTVLGAAAGVAYALQARQWWRSEVVVLQMDGRSTSGGLAQLSGLASLAGISLGGAAAAPQAPLAVLRSREFIREFIEEKNLTTVLLADEWDPDAKQWKQKNKERQPDIRDAVGLFDEKIRAVSEDKKTGLITLSITWTDAKEAADWANELILRVNSKLRNQALDDAQRNVTYLQREIATATVPALQQSLGKVLESEMQKMLIARGNEEFAFRIVDRAVPPKRRVKPQRPLVVLGATISTLLLSSIVVLIRAGMRERNVNSRIPQ
jgi:uncharacterized protein involved in exopolysaccharide biosynthesis